MNIYLSLGGNVGDTLAILDEVLKDLTSLPAISNVEFSRFYQTKPWGGVDQKDFINVVGRMESSIPLTEFHEMMQRIEQKHGKNTPVKNGPRTLDIDILFADSQIINSKPLTIPHPHWNRRLFVLIPLLDLTAEIIIDSQTHDINKLINTFSSDEVNDIVCIDRSRRFIHVK